MASTLGRMAYDIAVRPSGGEETRLTCVQAEFDLRESYTSSGVLVEARWERYALVRADGAAAVEVLEGLFPRVDDVVLYRGEDVVATGRVTKVHHDHESVSVEGEIAGWL